MRKYFVYIDDNHNVYKVAIPAENESKARDYCEGNGEIVAVRDITEDFPIDVVRVAEALGKCGFGDTERDLITRTLQICRIAE